MTVTGSPLDISDDEYEIFRDDVRMLLRDRAPNNLLLNDVQFTNGDIDRAVKFAVGEYNLVSPVTTVGWRLVPEPVLFLLTASYLMLSESFLQLRNQVSVPTDGLGVIGIDDKSAQYAQMRSILKEEGLNGAKQFKVQQNLESAYGSLSSGYAHVSRFRNN